MIKKDRRGGALQYEKGDLLGENKHIFIKEIEPKEYIVMLFDLHKKLQ